MLIFFVTKDNILKGLSENFFMVLIAGCLVIYITGKEKLCKLELIICV